MWIQNDRLGQPRFVLDEAYIYQPDHQPRQWVLLDEKPSPGLDLDYQLVMGHNSRGIAELQKSVSEPRTDAGLIGEYAIELASNRRFGAVFEIGWQQNLANGSGLCENNRRIYVFGDTAGRWHFLGEGPGVGHCRGDSHDQTASVEWLTNSVAGLPLEIRFVIQQARYQSSGPNADNSHDLSLVTFMEGALAGRFPARWRAISGRPWLLAEKDDTVERMVERLGYFSPGWEFWPEAKKRESEKRRILAEWAAALAGLNPGLPGSGKVQEGTRVLLSSPQEW